ncbi:50S ribosomal protein L19 [Candidatus Absconditicoccus praedator]|uniref:50S ribosomal protein L19 n=1 Tax=Candidatus Absconditicoccus praedator TaxID=2735562 RepID=UPI001E4485FC|nr:50S ribosomal protein L19 [Candidatus Absconditicoccus praedator]UFX83196.1 50S ribosomal protein L19 [Candidatus Absconditicoccus praedator]
MNFERLKKLFHQKGYKKYDVKPGQYLEISEVIGEGSSKRIWRFKGLVLRVKKKNSVDGTFTVRGKTSGIVVEKIYPLSFPYFDKITVLDEYRIRRAKLYYIRHKVGKSARMKSSKNFSKQYQLEKK